MVHPELTPIAPTRGLANIPGHSGAALAKEGRADFSVTESLSSGEEMNNGNHHSNGAEPARIWKARNFIEEHCAEEISLAQVAKAANTSANYFSEKFKEATGTNFVHYVARTRFDRAAALLSDRDLRVSEIAFATGFQSLSQFNRVFRKFAGKSPTEYRADLRNGHRVD
jgi:transcriptional regulator GlxA family with amidase domain